MERLYKNNFDTVFESSVAALKLLKWSVSDANKKQGVISASTRLSIWSWGENFTIRIQEIDDMVAVHVKSSAKAQLYTWGKNERNEQKFLDLLSDSLSES